jgi:tetratricopeptide (TPR) repeat protein
VSGQIAVNFDRARRGADAIDWYERAAREALVRSGYSEAVRFLERAHALTVELDDSEGSRRELQILSMLSTAIAAADSYASQRQLDVQERAIAVATLMNVDLDPTLLRARVMTNLCGDRFDEARTAAERLARTAAESGDEGLAAEGEYLLGISAFWACDLRSAREHFETVVERFQSDDPTGHMVRFGHDPRIVCASRLANTLWFLGDTQGALAMRERAMALAIDAPHPYSANVARVFSAVLAVDLADVDDIRERAAELSDGRDRSWVFDVNAEAMNGLVDVLDGRAADGIARTEAAIATLGPSSPAPGAISVLTRVLVGAHAFAGDPATGLAAVERALRLPGTRLWEREYRRLQAVFGAELTR